MAIHLTNSESFYLELKVQGLFRTLTQNQVDSINAILDECHKQDVTDNRQIAYILATAYHECHNPTTSAATSQC